MQQEKNTPDHSGFGTVNRFRARRGRVLATQIRRLAAAKGAPITVLDIGGRVEYWRNVGLEGIGRIVVLNHDETELSPGADSRIFQSCVGDARALTGHADKSFDLAHSNSVIEHVGAWPDMAAMAREALRVGRSGWVQTPAWEFPVEPHFRAPFLHWFGQPLRRRMLWMSGSYRAKSVAERRAHVDRINLLSRAEVEALFPGCDIFVERFLLPKSYVARW